MPEDQVKQTKLIVMISATMFLAIVSIICLIFIMKLRSDPNIMANFKTQQNTVKETTESVYQSEVEEKVIKPVNPQDVTLEEDLDNIKKDTLDKIKNTYDEYELDIF